MIYTPIKMFLFVPKHTPVASWGMPHDQLTEGEKNWAWFTNGFAFCKEIDSRSIGVLFLTTLKDTGKREIFMGRT